ncbi:hypothetical protein FHETE_4829 [Fusarium heterosporum]|uniref:Uncharacterized protein n=1 Tax=Fusarium heterosporum TaxID=42747 RepID=A0A8H5WTK7_FUSHE|nr:hypothetical protein FHETE_4829 [Fusarium heterosporum]
MSQQIFSTTTITMGDTSQHEFREPTLAKPFKNCRHRFEHMCERVCESIGNLCQDCLEETHELMDNLKRLLPGGKDKANEKSKKQLNDFIEEGLVYKAKMTNT